MLILELDIGTTTISAVVLEENLILTSLNRENGSFLTEGKSWEKLQNPSYIRDTALQMVKELLEAYPNVERIGITGQMHGIVYLDQEGRPVGPLYTWQEERGMQWYEQGLTYAEYLSRVSGYALATGYGLVTHFYNLKNGLVPEDAVVFCTIHDYIAMLLCGRKTPVIDGSDAARACHKSLYRTVSGKNSILINVGTGSQFSVYTREYMSCTGLETRPFPGGGYLLVEAPLCGGRAYAMLENFFRLTLQMMGNAECNSCYEAMAGVLENCDKPKDLPEVVPLFQGTRHNPQLRGSVQKLSVDNFTPLHMIWAWLQGMAQKLYQMAQCYLAAGGQPFALIGSGNGLRKNKYLQQCFSELFGQQLIMSECREEAACGAARFAAEQQGVLVVD